MTSLFITTARMLTIGLLMAFAGSAPAQQAYRSKPIRLVMPFSPGSGGDVMARIIAHELNESLGQSVVVDSRPGGSGIIATDAVAKAAPDGYSIPFDLIGIAIGRTQAQYPMGTMLGGAK